MKNFNIVFSKAKTYKSSSSKCCIDRDFSKTSLAEFIQDTEQDSNQMIMRFISSEGFRRMSLPSDVNISSLMITNHIKA